MPQIIFRNTIEIANPHSLSDRIAVETLALLCPGAMTIDDALAALEIEGAEWSAHEHLATEGDASLVVLVKTS